MEFPEWIIGLILSTMASFAGCLGLVLQKLTHQQIALARQKTLDEMNKSRKGSQEVSPNASGNLSPISEPRSPMSPTDPSRPNQNAHEALLEFSAEQQRQRAASRSRRRNMRGSTSTISEGDEQIDEGSEEEDEEEEAGDDVVEEEPDQPNGVRVGSDESTVGDLPEFKKESTGISIAEENAAGGDEAYTLEDVKPERYATKPIWLLGMLVVIIGSLLDVVAFGFAPQSLIAPLASLTLVFNTVVAPKLLGEKLSWRDKLATGIICVGTVLVVIFSSHNTPEYDVHALRDLYIRPIVLFYFIACAGFSIFLFLVASRFQYKEEDAKSPQPEGIWRHIYPFSFPGLAGTLGGLSLLFAKSSMELLKFSAATENQFVYPEPYVTITALFIFLYLQMRFLNSGLARFDALYVIPIYQVFWMISGIIGGGICFREFDDFGVLQAIMFPLGTFIDFFGIYILSARESLKLGEDEKHGEGLTVDGAKNVLAMAVHRQSVLFGPRNSVFGAMGSPLDKVFTPHMLPSNFLPPRRITMAQSARDLSSHRRMSYFDRMPFGGPGTMPSIHLHTSGAVQGEKLRARRHSEFPSKHRPRRSRVKQTMNDPREEIHMHASVPLSNISASAEDLPPPNPGPTPNNSESYANLSYAITPSPTMAPSAASPRSRPPAFSTSLSPRTQGGHTHSKSAGGASIAM